MSSLEMELAAKSVQEVEQIPFISSNKSGEHVRNDFQDPLPPLLTREDLIKIDKDEPIWRKLRIAFLVCFWLIWFSLLTATVLLIFYSEKCPNSIPLDFYQSKIGYWLDVFAFKDSNGDGIGDLTGLKSFFNFSKSTVGLSYLILDSLFKGYSMDQQKYLGGGSTSWDEIDPKLGTAEELVDFIKRARRVGYEVILSVDYNSLLAESEMVKSLGESGYEKLSIAGGKSRLNTDLKTPQGFSVYGAGSGMVDVDLNSDVVMAKVNESVRLILKTYGANGILLKDSAFLVNSGDSGSYPAKASASVIANQSWYKAELPMFTQNSVNFLTRLRGIVDQIASETGHRKVLIAESGNIGWGVPSQVLDPTERYLENGTTAAHMIISRQFVRNRGWKVDPQDPVDKQISLAAYMKSTSPSLEMRMKHYLPTATWCDSPHRSVHATVLSFLLPGVPIVYYGSELGLDLTSPIKSLNGLYPGNKQSLDLNEIKPMLNGHLPLPWDQRGVNFTDSKSVQQTFASYISANYKDSTIETMAFASGRDEAIYDLVTSLVRMRATEPSLQFGTLQVEALSTAKVEIFLRDGGYRQRPLLAVILTKSQTEDFNLNINDVENCQEAQFLYSFPQNSKFKQDERMLRIVKLRPLHSGSSAYDATVYIFKCNSN